MKKRVVGKVSIDFDQIMDIPEGMILNDIEDLPFLKPNWGNVETWNFMYMNLQIDNSNIDEIDIYDVNEEELEND